LKPVGIVSALAAEARTLGPAEPQGTELRRLGDGALLAVSGIGQAAAAAAARRLVLAGAGALASYGMAGGLDPTLICGAVLLPEEIVAAGGADSSEAWPTSRHWRERLRAALPDACIACGGRLFTSERPLAHPEAKAAAWRRMGAAAVDMESAAIAQVAAQAGLPFIVLRVIVDTATDELPAAVILASGGGRLRIGRLIAALARAPAEVSAVIRLSARYRIAGRVLRTVAATGSAARRALAGGEPQGPPAALSAEGS
jgi:adenosylhomocysteine nucleosidase